MSKLIEKHSVGEELATQAIDVATTKARELGVAVAIAVVDESGVLKAFRRMDGAPLGTVELGPAKARMAASFGAPSSVFHGLAKDDGAIAVSLAGITGVTVLGGGEPIVVGGALAGAIGVSGGTEEQDIEIAQAAVEAVTAGG